MGNNNTNTKLFIEAVLADMSGLSKELRKNLESVDTELPLKFDSEELEEGVLGALREAFRGLESSRFASQLDLSEFISAIFKQLQQGTVTNDKADFVYAFADSVKIFESFAERFGGDAKVVSQTIRELNESLTAQGIQDYLTNLKAVYKFIDNLELKPKDKDRLLASFTSSLGVGVDANGLGDALGLKKVLEDDAEKYKDVTKFAVSVKEARKRLIELLGGTDDFKGWNDLLPGTKSRSDTARTRDIAGFISRIEALSGKEITAYLQDKIDDAETDTATRAQLERLQKLYTEKGGWGEYYLKWSEKDNAGLQTLNQNNNLIVEMTRRQLEERQKVFEKYGKYNASLLTKGQSPQSTIEYDTKAEAVQTNEELTTEEQTRRQIADQINQEAEELKKKLNVLKEIAELQKQVVNSGVEATPEYQEMQYLQDVLDDVTLAVNNKTKAFEDERGVVHSVAKAEVKDLQSIQDKLLEITGFENEEDKMGKMSKPRQVLKELTEEQRKQAEEAQKAIKEAEQATGEAVRKKSILGELRKEQEKEKSKDKPKSGVTLKKQNLPSVGASNKTSEKTANEREAQALKDINANAENATAGLKKFGDTNSEIAQNVTTVAEALKKEASALNSITRTLLKVEDSKIFQDARKDKLQTALSETRDNIASSQKEVEALQKSTDIKIFNKDHLEEASAQLRSAYKDVATFKDIYSKDASHENMIEMTKREIKLWKAYKEAEKQSITDSNLEAKRLNPANFGIDSNKNADNVKILREEIESRKQIYEDYLRQAENIRKELEEIENPPTQKNLEKKDATIKDYQEAIGIIKEYIQAQMELAKVQEASSSESIEAKFNPEQLEQFVTTLGTISETLNKIQTASESFGKNIDFSTVIEQLESINNILSTFMGNITFDDFKDIFTVTIDEAADKIDDFKNALNLETTASRFEEQISQIQKKIEEFQTQLAQRDAKLEDNSLLIEQKETMGIVKEYIQAQQALAEMQQKMTPEATQVFFTPEQLEQFNAIIQSIIDATGKIETALGNLDNKVDLFPILEQLQSLNNILSNFINNISFDEFTVVFAFAIDKMINKINEFKTALNLDDVTAKYELQISQLQEKSKDLQNQLSEIKSNDNKSVEAIFNLEQLEQFSTTLINISDSLNKIQSALGTLDDNSDIPSITQSIKAMVEVFQKLELLIDDINNKKIKFGFSSNPNEKLIGEMNSEEVRKSLTGLFDDAIQKIQKFKTNVDMTETVKNFKSQMSEMEKAARQQAKQIEKLEQALEKEKKAREDDKAKIKVKENKTTPTTTEKSEEKAKQDIIEEKERLKKEIEQKPVEAKIPVEVQLSVEGTKDKNLFDDMSIDDLLENYGEITGSDLSKPISLGLKKGFSTINLDDASDQLLSDLYQQQEELIGSIETRYSKLITSDKYINDELNIEKILNPFREQFTKKGINTKNFSELTTVREEIKKVKAELASSFDSEGKIIGDPLKIKELLEQYNNLTTRVKELKAAIQSPTSEENIALQMAKDADKAKEELEKLKKEVDEFFENRKNDVVRRTAEQVIGTYGTTNEEGKLVSVRSSFFDNNPNYEDLIEQQNYVIALAKALNEYKIAVENLKKTKESDIIKVDDLKEANKQVELLEDKIKQLETIIRKVGKGKTNATDKNINDLTAKIQSILEKNSDLPEDASERLKGYLDVLKSGASISKAAYNSMTADVKQFSVEQKKSFSVWDMMTLKIKEGIAYLATKFSFYQIFNQFRQGFQTIRQFDDALTEMMKVSDETRKSLEAYQKTTFDTADAIGSNALQIQNSTADFMRLGESLKEASESAKTANVLMNVSEFQSIDEATKSLIAMSAAYDDLSKSQIIDKLNEVGNNYSISTSGAAEALQASASALKTAGNDMDEALALVTAGNQIVQDVAKAGNGLRTIALRLTGTKSAKEELEEMGEDTDSLITTQSKLRDTIKEATAVASNQFKGFDILDDNGNYKSTYEIMLGIAQIYQEIVDTDKELGRNNANLLLETVAGKTRANIAASIFQSPDVLQAAYESSQNADNSAMKENDKYLQSISGHLSQLTNQWQEMWANAANREIINYFIDLGKALLQVIDFFGVLPSTIVGAMVYFNLIKKAAEDKSIIKGIGAWIKGLAEAQAETGGLAYELVALKKWLGGIIPILGGVGTAIGLVLLTAHAAVEHQKQVQKELVDSVRATNEEWQSQKQTLSDYASQYEELKTKLDTGNLSEQETLEVKQQIYDIQKQITEQYGTNAGKIDLINGKLREQLNIISGISEAEANRIWNSAKYQKGFEIAKKAMTTESDYSLSQAFDINNIKTDEDKALSELVKQYTESRKPSRDSGSFSPYRVISGTPIEAEKQINELIEQIEKLQEQNPNNEKFQKRAEEVISYLNTHIDTITKIREDNEASYFEGLPIELMATKGAQNYKTYTDYQSAVSNLESAYISGDTKQINKAREAYEEATKAKDEFLRLPENNEYSMLFDQIDTSVVDTKNKTEDATKAIKKSLQTGKEIESDLSRFDEYRQEKIKADNYIKTALKGGHLEKIGNVDNINRPIIFWDEEEVEKQKDALESWGESVEDVIGSYSTVFGGSGQFHNVEIAYTPIIDDGTGKGKLLTKETLNKYINTLFDNTGESWTSEELLRLDAQGLVIDGQKISNVLAQIGNKAGDTSSGIALTAEQVGELMHEWQSRSLGYIENYQDEWKEAIKQGKSFEEYMADQEKDLKDVTKATGKYTKEDKQLYQALKRVIDLDIDKVDAEQAFDESANGSQIYRMALEDLMNALGYTMDDSALMIDMLVANGIIYGDVSDATLSASDAYNQFSQEVATAIENVSKLNEVLTESVSGAGISTQNIDAFKEMFGDDYVYALERSANGYHINAEKLQTLTDKQKALINADFQNTLDAQYDALKRCNDEITSMSSKGEDISGLLSNREGILKRIQDTKDLMMAYQASTSAYQTWINAQSNGNEYDMYDKIASGYDTVKDLIDRGWSGDDTVRSYLDLIYGDSFDAFTASGEECAEMFDNLDKKIEGTTFSINDFFQVDESGKLTSNGIFNFFDAVKEKQKELKKEWLTLDENGNITDFNFGIGGDREVAEALSMDVELVQSILRAAVSAGFELNLDQPMWAMDELESKAIAAQEELGGFNNIDFSEFNEEFLKSDEAYEVLSGHVSDVYDYIQEIENSDKLAPDVKTDMIENAQDMLAYLVALEREAADKGDIDLKIKVAEKATNSIKQLIDDAEELPKELSEYNWDSITDAEGLEKAKDYIETLKGSGAIDTSTAETFLSILYEAIDQLNIIDNYEANPEFKGNTVEAFNNVENARKELEQYIATAQQLEEKHDITFNFAEDGKVNQLLSIIYGEGTPEILASLDIDSNKTPTEIIEMLESGERDVDVLLKPDSSELEEKIKKANQEKVVTHKVNSVANDIVNKTTNIVEEQTNQIVNTSMDTSSYDEGANHVEETNEKLVNGDTNVEVGMDKKEFEQGSKETENKVSSLDKLGAFPSVTLTGVSQVVSGSETIKSSIDSIKGKTISVTANFFSNGLSALQDGIQSAINKARELMNTNIHLANGTAHFQGTAFSRGSIVSSSAYAGGKWGLPNDQTALTGELGTEIVVRDGNWFTVGDNGAEFVNLKKGDIVFNHKQAQELLENGYVTSNKGRGHLVGFANGTAYSSGSSSGATRARVKTTSKKSSSKSSSGSGRSSGGSGGSGGGGGNNSSSKDAKETKNTLDEVEILISRIERSISNLDKTIGSTYTTWSKRNNAIASNLKNVSTEIKDQEKAFTTYVNKAKSVGLSSSWKTKIRTGAFRIEDVKDSDLWDKINEYKQWWEKALAAKDAIVDLREKEGELYKQRFDNEQSYYEAVIADTQHALDLIETYNDQLSEAGRLGSVTNIQQQIVLERKRLAQLTSEYNSLIKQRDNAVKSGKIIKGSEAWNEMQQSINEVSESIAEANTNLITFANNIRDISFDRWEKIHDAIGGVVNELEFFYDMLDSDKMFDEQGTITNQGITGFALLAQEYDTYFKEVQRYQTEIDETNKMLSKAKYDQNLVDKLKELKEAQQDAAANAKKTKDSMVDLTEDGIKKQIDYVKKLIEDYEDLLETQKDQTDYAKKVADQQKEINKLEKQYRAIQNDNSEEGATKRQQLRDQINEKRQELQETQEDRRLSETKDMLGDFEEKFEEFLENKLKNIEGIVREVINATNENKNVIKDTINNVANSYGYTPSDTLKAAINTMSNNLVSYFNGSFQNPQVTSIAQGVDAIVKYFTAAQKNSEQDAKNRVMADKVKQSGTHIQTYTDDSGKTKTGYFKDDGTLDTKYTGWAAKDGSTYRFNNGELMKGSQWITAGGKKYYLDNNGTRVTNAWRNIGGKLYHFNQNGEMQTGLATINGNQYYFDKNGINQKGLQTINGKRYYFDTSSGAMAKNTWRKINGNLYHFNQNGEAQTGLYSINGKQFYFDKNGISQKGLQTIGGIKYYFDDSGVMVKDAWRQVGDGLYHFGKDGKAAKGWMKTDSGKWFFFDPKTSKRIVSQWIHNNAVTTKPVKGDYYVGADGVRVINGKRKTNKGYMTFDANGKWKGYKTGTKGVPRNDLYWTNEGRKPEAIIRKSDGAILTPLNKGDSVIPNSAMKNMYQALTDPAKYLKQYTTPDIKVVQSNNNSSNTQPPVVNMQFIANGVQDANKFVNDLMNNKKLEKWIQEVTLGQANGNNNYKKYSYVIR